MDHEDIGPMVRRMRKGAAMTLQQMSMATGLSQSFLSQFERGRTQASISSLRLITEALGMNIHDVFGAVGTGGYSAVVRAAGRPGLPFGDKALKTIVNSRGLSRFEILEVSFEPGGSTGEGQYSHGHHEELIVVLGGSIGVELGEERHLLDAGDSLSFHSTTPHRVVNAGGDIARVFWVISPPGAHRMTPPDLHTVSPRIQQQNFQALPQ
ncbi:helix-turn-helix domain-containing protein [Leucobacter denitrificans]|uniref:Helix-turn-helix transcriptional regulator n=1 Tax=Leucobacter denitrificans TaxID=683042 RepID=A0A7G9S222_9MICO|nr:XRE family transcriptional regulator [Leucobacter denitrificans]QNN61897.1 helix-turn-helix transcriptional regulator [Leucobacter denitrificans]